MDDDDDMIPSGLSNADEDLSLPKATITKLMRDHLPSEVICSMETRQAIMECCTEFVHLISSEANEISEKDNKKTITADHINAALASLGFEDYIEKVRAVAEEHKTSIKEREKRTTRLKDSGMSHEELLALQEQLFSQARAKMDNPAAADASTE